jgi:RimJ/RimL family protein N-acetyltransferase
VIQIRPAQVDNAARIDLFLCAHIETSMFLLSNLRDHGPCGGAHKNAMRFWMVEQGGDLIGVFALSTIGGVLMQLPGFNGWDRIADTLRPYDITGIIGEADQCRALINAAGLGQEPSNLDTKEKLYTLGLRDLILPPGETLLAPLDDATQDIAIQWRMGYHIETLGTPADEAPAMAQSDITAYRDRGSHRVLMDSDTPVAFTGFNAMLDHVVQIGGVYTPPDLRGQGHARRAVALHLQEARDRGATRAILFAANQAAERAYEAIGFHPIGNYNLTLFRGPVRID